VAACASQNFTGPAEVYMSAGPDGLFQPCRPPLNQPDRATFHGGAEGHTDYPDLSEAA
jgi:hypothetical protein